MAQKKRQRFEAIKSFPNVLEYPLDMSGQWHTFFKNDHPLILELACGRGEYAIGLAKLYPHRNFIGVDLKGNRIFIGARTCLEQQMPNVVFLRTQIDRIHNYFVPGEVSAIWITFPDPQLRPSKAKKRLTHPGFLRLYQQILHPGGLIHIKTDSPDLFAFTLMVIEMYGLILHAHSPDIYAAESIAAELQIKTHYEKLDIAQCHKVHYVCFSLPARDLDSSLDEVLDRKVKNVVKPIANAFTIPSYGC